MPGCTNQFQQLIHSIHLQLYHDALLLGLPALYARQATQVRWIGLVGLIIWLDVLIFPVLQGGIGGLIPALTPPAFLYIIGPLTIIGTLFFGIMTMRAGVFPGWLGFCLFVRYLGDTCSD